MLNFKECIRINCELECDTCDIEIDQKNIHDFILLLFHKGALTVSYLAYRDLDLAHIVHRGALIVFEN